ncbi:hypothetical protein ABW21_db0206516 [Orbilia brochopaga]|nr:hypothetical protein ABW21_db0206516 [Drechslerella brochopaga]
MSSPPHARKTLWQLFDTTRRHNQQKSLEADPWAYRVPRWYPIQPQSLRPLPNTLRESAELLAELVETTGEEGLFEGSFAGFIYSSNAIEQTGPDRLETFRIVRDLLKNHESMDSRWLEITSETSRDFQTRREVVQHVTAFLFLKQHIDEHGQLSEEGLLECHRILMDGVPSSDGETNYQGVYRSCELRVGDPLRNMYGEEKKLAAAAEVKDLMGPWVEKFNEALTGTHDPIAVGSMLKIQFLEIHPFLDGNGRMSRMLLNALVTAYLPHTIITFGENKKERAKYQQSVRETIKTSSPGILAFFSLKRASKATLERLQKAEIILSRSSRATDQTTAYTHSQTRKSNITKQ